MEVPGKRAETKPDFQCELCEFENVTTEANGICRDCGEYMCVSCFQNHLKGKMNRNHELIDVNDSDIATKINVEEVEKCKQHDNEAIRFYCHEHDIVGCGDCIILQHSKCKPEYIKDLSKNVQKSEDFINLKRKIEQLEHERNKNFAKMRNYQKDCAGMHEEVLKKIKKFRTDINTYLDKAEADIMSEVKILMSVNDTILDGLEDKCNMLTSKIKSLEQTLDTKIHKENVLFIQKVLSKSKVLESELELSKYEELECKIKRYDFVPDQHWCSIITSPAKLGCFDISNIKTSTCEDTANNEGIDWGPVDRDRADKFMDQSVPDEEYKDTGARRLPVVGARVRYLGISGLLGFYVGTVTAVQEDGTMDVNWDSSGETRSGYSLGRGWGGVELI